MAKSRIKQPSRSVDMVEALRRRTDNIAYDEVSIPGKNAGVRVVRGTELPSARRLAGFLARGAAYYAVEVYRARFNSTQDRRKTEMIQFAQRHPGIRGMIQRTARVAVFPTTEIKYDQPAMQETLGDRYDDVVTATWTASVTIPAEHTTPFGGPLTPEALTRAFNLGMTALAGFDEDQMKASTSVNTSHEIDEKALYGMVENGRITAEQLAGMGTAQERWSVRLTPQIEGADAPEVGLTVAGADPVPLQP